MTHLQPFRYSTNSKTIKWSRKSTRKKLARLLPCRMLGMCSSMNHSTLPSQTIMDRRRRSAMLSIWNQMTQSWAPITTLQVPCNTRPRRCRVTTIWKLSESCSSSLIVTVPDLSTITTWLPSRSSLEEIHRRYLPLSATLISTKTEKSPSANSSNLSGTSRKWRTRKSTSWLANQSGAQQFNLSTLKAKLFKIHSKYLALIRWIMMELPTVALSFKVRTLRVNCLQNNHLAKKSLNKMQTLRIRWV